jgi:hypothetical protein
MKSVLLKALVPFFVMTMIAVDYASARGGGGRGGSGGRGGGWSQGGGSHHGGHRHNGFRNHGGSRFGFFVGGIFAPWYYYYGPPYYVPSPYSLGGYVEQDGYWYYCPALQTYYPYVMQCPGEWQRVDPQPPAPDMQAPPPA